jgi:hypothetical protein
VTGAVVLEVGAVVVVVDPDEVPGFEVPELPEVAGGGGVFLETA